MKRWNIDLDYEQIRNRDICNKSISILIGAGFSAIKGYPTGNELNRKLQEFDEEPVTFSPSGELAISTDGRKPQFQIPGIYNQHQKYFIFCNRLIKEYCHRNKGIFDYEQFYHFIKSEHAKNNCYRVLCNDLLDDNGDYENYLFNIRHIYNQMVEYLLRDKNGKNRYDDEPFKIGYIDGYNGFLDYISKLSLDSIINVHTLNHDLLFESFNRTEYINGNISDGFDEYGSEYYGKLSLENRTYHCRLERFTNRYNTPIRLFKLHGSIDYVPFYRTSKDGYMKLDKYVKIKWGMSAGDLLKSKNSKMKYDMSPFEYHSDFLTGTTSKIQRYDEPKLFKKLFTRFKKNLHNAEKLIIIGYGCKDEGINNIIKEHYDFRNKPIFIIDKYAEEAVENFKEDLNATLYKIDIAEITSDLFSNV